MINRVTRPIYRPLQENILINNKEDNTQNNSARYETRNSNVLVDNPANRVLVQKNQNFPETYDSFTTLRDKNYLLNKLPEQMEESIIEDKNLHIVMFDMDNFKSINEILGYTIGDEFIKTIANTIKNCALKQDNHAYRYGGEEFFIIGKGNNSEKIVEIAEEIQEAISKNPNLSSYSKKYIENIQNKLNLIEPQTSAINQINTLKSQLALIEEFEDSFNKKSKEFTILINKKEEIMSELKFLYNLLLANLEIQANNHANKYVLDKYINELNNPDCDINTFVNNENLNNYLNSMFNKSNKISQLKSWKQDHLDQNGFSTTAAILTYSPDSLLDTTSENIIYNVGEHLKEGKEVKKGKLYIKHV